MSEIEAIEFRAGVTLPAAHRRVLETVETDKARAVCGPVLIYSAAEVVERNETYETKRYCPDHITVGDGGGGRAVIIGLECPGQCPVFVVDHGSMSLEDFELVAADLATWLAAGCPVPGGEA